MASKRDERKSEADSILAGVNLDALGGRETARRRRARATPPPKPRAPERPADAPAGGVYRNRTAGGLVRVAVYLTEDQKGQLDNIAGAAGRSLSDVLKQIVFEYLEDR